MSKSTYNVFMWIGIVIFLFGSVLTVPSGYAIWRNLESVGIHKFTTTGKMFVREEQERTGRRSTKTVKQNYAVYATADGKYSYEGKISPTQKSRMSRGSKFSIDREVLVDRYGDYVVSAPKDKEERNSQGWTNLIIFMSITLVGGAIAFFSYRKKKSLSDDS